MKEVREGDHVGHRTWERGREGLGGLCLEDRAVWWQISAQRMVISDGLFIQGLQTRPRTSLSLLGLKGPPTTQPNSSHSTLAPISSCLFPSTTQPGPAQSRQRIPTSRKAEKQADQCHSRNASIWSPPFGQSVSFNCCREMWCGGKWEVTNSIYDLIFQIHSVDISCLTNI